MSTADDTAEAECCINMTKKLTETMHTHILLYPFTLKKDQLSITKLALLSTPLGYNWENIPYI